MLRGGRPKDVIWEHFVRVEVGGKFAAKCIYCGHQQSVKACRMKSHYANCKSAATENDRPKDQATPLTAKRPLEENSVTEPAAKKIVVQQKMSSHVVKTCGTAKSNLDNLVAKFFYSCNIPFAVAEHPSFRAMIQGLRPGYQPPTRKALSEHLLDNVTDELKTEMKNHLKDKTVTLIEDGWSNVHNDPVLATSVQTESAAFFLDAVDTGSMVKSAVNCTELCKESIRKAESEFGCKVRNVVTDNAKNMEKMREAIQADDPDINTYGCSAHWLNLLGDDITPAALMKHINEISKYFRNHHAPCAWLQECSGSLKPQLPGDTRWKSQLTAIDTYLRNRVFYVQIAQEHEDEMDRVILQKIMDYNVYSQAKSLKEQLLPVAVALDICQKDNTGLATACDRWLSLLEEPALQAHMTTVRKRFNQAVKPCHLVAYLLHPEYQGTRLTSDQRELAHQWLVQKNPDYLAAAIAFETRSSPFPPSFFSAGAMHPALWWKGLYRTHLPEGFVDLLVSLQTACASSASIERIFSSFGIIHNKLRNRLGVSKAAKLVFCYRMLRGNLDVDY